MELKRARGLAFAQRLPTSAAAFHLCHDAIQHPLDLEDTPHGSGCRLVRRRVATSEAALDLAHQRRLPLDEGGVGELPRVAVVDLAAEAVQVELAKKRREAAAVEVPGKRARGKRRAVGHLEGVAGCTPGQGRVGRVDDLAELEDKRRSHLGVRPEWW